MSNVDVIKGLSTLREDVEHYINMELYNITKENGNHERMSNLRAFAMAAYNVGLITMDEVHHCSAAIRLSRWQVVTVHFDTINDIGDVFASRADLNLFFADKLLAKCDESMSSANTYIEYCLTGPAPHILVDKAETRNLLKCASNATRNAKAYLTVGVNTSLLQEAQVAQYVARANQMLNTINDANL